MADLKSFIEKLYYITSYRENQNQQNNVILSGREKRRQRRKLLRNKCG